MSRPNGGRQWPRDGDSGGAGASATLRVSFLDTPLAAGDIWTEIPAALTEVSPRLRKLVNLKGVAVARLIVTVPTPFPAGVKLALAYAAPGGSFTDIGAQLPLSSGGDDPIATSYFLVPVGMAVASVVLTLKTVGGTGLEASTGILASVVLEASSEILTTGDIVSPSNLQFDVDATTITPVADATAITAWADNSGNARNGSGSGTSATYRVNGIATGKPSVRTTGTAVFQFPAAPLGDASIYIVMKTSSAGASNDSSQWYSGAAIFDAEVGGSTNDWGITLKSTGHIAFGVGNGDTTGHSTGAVFNDGTPHILCVTRVSSSGLVKIYRDDVEVYSGLLTAGVKNTPSLMYIGQSASSGTTVTDYGRILMYSVTHNTLERSSTTNALRTQFGI